MGQMGPEIGRRSQNPRRSQTRPERDQKRPEGNQKRPEAVGKGQREGRSSPMTIRKSEFR